MEVLDTLINAFVIGVAGLLLGLQTRHGLAGVREEIADLRRELHEEIRAVRSDLTNVALAVGAAPSTAAGRSGRRPTS